MAGYQIELPFAILDSRCLPGILPESKTASPDQELNLIRWAAEQKPYFSPPEVREVKIGGANINRVTVKDRNGLICCGRSVNLHSAMSKAFGEIIERWFAAIAFKSGAKSASKLKISSDKWQVFESEKTSFPPKALWTTNGWAAHFEPVTALRNAAMEAIERHLILLSFFSYGWNGFCAKSQPLEVLGKQVFKLEAQTEVANIKAGLAIAKLENHKGATFGHFCETNECFENSQTWTQPILEATESAIYLDKLNRNDIQKLLHSKDRLVKSQAKFALKLPRFNGLPIPITKHEIQASIEASFIVFDVQGHFNLKFPFYLAFVFGGDLIPLILDFNVQKFDDTLIQYLFGSISKYGLSLNSIREHPFV